MPSVYNPTKQINLSINAVVDEKWERNFRVGKFFKKPLRTQDDISVGNDWAWLEFGQIRSTSQASREKKCQIILINPYIFIQNSILKNIPPIP